MKMAIYIPLSITLLACAPPPAGQAEFMYCFGLLANVVCEQSRTEGEIVRTERAFRAPERPPPI